QGLALMTGLIVGQALSAILALGAHRVEILSGRWSRISADRLWRFGWPTCIKTVTAFVEAYLDRLLLIALVDAAAAGIYGVSYDLLSRSLTLLTGAVSMAGMPLVVRAISEGGLHAAYKRLSSYFTLLLGITMPASFGLLLLNKNLCVVLVGEMYRDGVIMVLPLVALATVLRMIREFYSDFAFEAIRQPKKQLPVYYATATASVALNLILIPLYGLKGAAIAMVVAQLFGLALSWILIRRLFPLPFPRLNTLKITLASVAMSTALWPTLPHVGWQVLIGQVVLGAGVYILALYVLDLNGMRRRFRWNTVLDTLFPVPVPHPLPSETEPPGNIL
ncbi:MAG: polysaccharide biosynthesis C-terminal domain-containing protein, partial [Rhodospirillales bacterium]|nr:polysaccharide biosynthesis C-terminal domain-containing protein [Rhodospirillales bacterium]